MLNKFKASMPGFDVNSLLKSVKDSLTEMKTEDLGGRDAPSCEIVKIRDGKFLTQTFANSSNVIQNIITMYHSIARCWRKKTSEH